MWSRRAMARGNPHTYICLWFVVWECEGKLLQPACPCLTCKRDNPVLHHRGHYPQDTEGEKSPWCSILFVIVTTKRMQCFHLNPIVLVISHQWVFINTYYKALLNAVGCSIHLNGPSQHSAVSYFCIIDRCWAYLTIVKESGLHDSDSHIS